MADMRFADVMQQERERLHKEREQIFAQQHELEGKLADINRELGADFDLSAFRHRAIYNRDMHRIEMHLDSLRDQTVTIPGVGEVKFSRGESIRTELSCKYDRRGVDSMFRRAGLRLDKWLTGNDKLFALAVGSAQGARR